MEDLTVTKSRYDFAPANAAMQRYIDGNLLAGHAAGRNAVGLIEA